MRQQEAEAVEIVGPNWSKLWRSHREQARRSLVQLWTENGQTVAGLARVTGLSVLTLRNWRKEDAIFAAMTPTTTGRPPKKGAANGTNGEHDRAR